jgi:hypothetical protein
MSQFHVVLGFLIFLIPIGVMLENANQIRKFEFALNDNVQTQLGISRSMQMQINNIQSVILAGIKVQKKNYDARESEFREISRRLDVLLASEHADIKPFRYSIKQMFLARPSPISP